MPADAAAIHHSPAEQALRELLCRQPSLPTLRHMTVDVIYPDQKR